MAIRPLDPANPAPSVDMARLSKASVDFEALLLKRMLAAARSAETGPQADWRAMADERLAADLAATSPLGIAALLQATKEPE